MPLQPSSPATLHLPLAHPGFQWRAAAAYLFDIDGTLLNSRDNIHYFAFQNAVRETLGIEVGLEGIQLHGNTDPGILRAALARKGLADHEIGARLPRIIEKMCLEVLRNKHRLQPELCCSIPELLSTLGEQGKVLGAASGNLERIGWAKLEKAGVRELFSFGAFSWPRESRVEIFRHAVELAPQHLLSPASNDSVFVVGDPPADIAAGRELRLPVIAVATGIYRFQELQSCNPDLCVASAADLLALP